MLNGEIIKRVSIQRDGVAAFAEVFYRPRVDLATVSLGCAALSAAREDLVNELSLRDFDQAKRDAAYALGRGTDSTAAFGLPLVFSADLADNEFLNLERQPSSAVLNQLRMLDDEAFQLHLAALLHVMCVLAFLIAGPLSEIEPWLEQLVKSTKPHLLKTVRLSLASR